MNRYQENTVRTTRAQRPVSDSFRARADSACFFEAWVGSALARAGLYTLHHPFNIDNQDHGMSHDLSVLTGPDFDLRDPTWTTVEVKSVNVKFTTASTYPFSDILVCSQNSFLRKWPGSSKTKRDFLFVSRDTGNIVWLPVGSMVELGIEVMDGTELYRVVQAKKTDLRELSDFCEVIRGIREQE